MPKRVTVTSLLLFLSHSTAAGRRTKKLSPHEGQDARCLWMVVAFIGFGSLYCIFSFPLALRHQASVSRMNHAYVSNIYDYSGLGSRKKISSRMKWTLMPKDYITRADNLDLFPASVGLYLLSYYSSFPSLSLSVPYPGAFHFTLPFVSLYLTCNYFPTPPYTFH